MVPSEEHLLLPLDNKKLPKLPSSGFTLTYSNLRAYAIVVETPTRPCHIHKKLQKRQPYEVLRLCGSYAHKIFTQSHASIMRGEK